MGVIKAATEYKERIDTLYSYLDALDRVIILLPDELPRVQLEDKSFMIRKIINWLREDQEELFKAIDKALEKK